MDPSRAARPLLVSLLVFAACSSSPEAMSPAPTPAASRSPSAGLAQVAATSSPTLVDKDCTDFASTKQAQDFYIEAGGPDQDLHGLDPDRNGNACDDQRLGAPSPARIGAAPGGGTSTAVQADPRTPRPTTGPPKSYTSSSGSVDGKSGGSDRTSSCESSDSSRCD